MEPEVSASRCRHAPPTFPEKPTFFDAARNSGQLAWFWSFVSSNSRQAANGCPPLTFNIFARNSDQASGSGSTIKYSGGDHVSSHWKSCKVTSPLPRKSKAVHSMVLSPASGIEVDTVPTLMLVGLSPPAMPPGQPWAVSTFKKGAYLIVLSDLHFSVGSAIARNLSHAATQLPKLPWAQQWKRASAAACCFPTSSRKSTPSLSWSKDFHKQFTSMSRLTVLQ
mmetsp:Transcript_123420/g.356801  ORF Transcript_123420/g.356801 Transcript_123420/m.356801 type:complete len:223 (-) Transcript_123420:973-1641(-)